MLWQDLREEEFPAAIEQSGKLCVVPIGCLEMHGQHLPVGTDTKTCAYIAQRAAEIEPVCVFPELYFGDVHGLTTWHGAVILSTELMLRMLTELCAEIARNGFKKILLLNGHGGNIPLLNTFVRSTMHDKKDYVVMCRKDFCYMVEDLVRELNAGVEFPELSDADIAYVRDFVAKKGKAGHAGLNETSILLKIDPQHVRTDRMHAVDGSCTHASSYLKRTGILPSTRFWHHDYPNSYEGDHADLASAGIGAALLRRRIERQAETCRLLKQDDRILEWNAEWNDKWL